MMMRGGNTGAMGASRAELWSFSMCQAAPCSSGAAALALLQSSGDIWLHGRRGHARDSRQAPRARATTRGVSAHSSAVHGVALLGALAWSQRPCAAGGRGTIPGAFLGIPLNAGLEAGLLREVATSRPCHFSRRLQMGRGRERAFGVRVLRQKGKRRPLQKG